MQVQRDFLICYIEYAKAFDRLQQLGIDGKDIRFMRSLHWEQTATIKVKTELSQFIKSSEELGKVVYSCLTISINTVR